MLALILNRHETFGEEKPAAVHINPVSTPSERPERILDADTATHDFLCECLKCGGSFDAKGLPSNPIFSNSENPQNAALSSFNTQATCWTDKTKKLEGAQRRIKARELCGYSGSHLFGDACKISYFVPYRCKNPFCPTCARLDSINLQKKYEPVIKKFGKRTTKFLTLTLKNVEIEGLSDAIDNLMKSFTCLKDIRFGPGAFQWYDELFPVLLKYSKLSEPQQEKQLYLYEKFKSFMLRMHKSKVKSPKLRNVSKGLARLEIVNKGNGYHVHMHIVIDINTPIPQELISHLWEEVTGGSMVVDIRKTYGDISKELLKYQLKYWEFELNDEEMLHVLASLHGRKKVWLWGCKPEKAEKQCFCGDKDCTLEYKEGINLLTKLTHSVIKDAVKGDMPDIFGRNRDGKLYEITWKDNAFIMVWME